MDDCGFEMGEVPNRHLCGCDECEDKYPSSDYDGPVPQEWVIERDYDY